MKGMQPRTEEITIHPLLCSYYTSYSHHWHRFWTKLYIDEEKIDRFSKEWDSNNKGSTDTNMKDKRCESGKTRKIIRNNAVNEWDKERTSDLQASKIKREENKITSLKRDNYRWDMSDIPGTKRKGVHTSV